MNRSLLTRRLIAFVFVLLMLASCSSLPPNDSSKPSTDPEIARAQQLYQQQDYRNAAPAYLALAAKHAGAKSQQFLLFGADAALLGDDIATARAALFKLNPNLLGDHFQLLHQLVNAEMALQDKQVDNAVQILLHRQPLPNDLLSLRKRYYHTLAHAYQQQGDPLRSAQALQNNLDLLQDPQERFDQQLNILTALNIMSTPALSQQQSPPPDTMSGWMQLALLSKKYRNDLPALQQAFYAWRNQFPNHPALLNELIAHQKQLYSQAQNKSHIAVLLPQSGKYAKVSEAIRDGMVISLQDMPLDQRPTLSFYDSSNTQAIWPLYNQAIDKGADFVIGPLQKNAVTQLIRAGELRAPVLALNIVNIDSIIPDNLYMFSLDPEDEARQVAERMWHDEKRRPVALVPDNAWGERLLKAFDERWQTLSHRKVDARKYKPNSYDHTKAITELLRINRSKARHSQLQRWLGRSLEFIPRRRTDVDAVFLATRAQHAAAFSPQFKYHLAGDLPIYTTSHVWRGSISRQQLTDMRKIILPDIPLLVTQAERTALAQEIPGIRGGLVRLYAMGMDALNLVPHLQRLQNNPDETLNGRTGHLYIDAHNKVQRQLIWLQLDHPVKTLGFTKRLLDEKTASSNAATPIATTATQQQIQITKPVTNQTHGSPTTR